MFCFILFYFVFSQTAIFEEISQLVQSALDGYKVCIFAYGQTGSGKTYTMEGPTTNSNDNRRGMIPRAVEQIFSHAQNLKSKGWRYECKATFLEIYNEKIRDLLAGHQSHSHNNYNGNHHDSMSFGLNNNTNNNNNGNNNHSLFNDIMMSNENDSVMGNTGNNNNSNNSNNNLADDNSVKYLELQQRNRKNKAYVEVAGLSEHFVTCAADVYPLLKRASKNRSVGKTDCNERSSRSHSIFQLYLAGYNECTQRKTFGVLNLIDLAGSERLKKSNATGQQLKETQAINRSLSCLGDVIAALSKQSKHIPYRNSKLTHLLMNYFGGDSKTLMFVNLCPEWERFDESLCSLRFAAKVNDCQIGVARRNVMG